MRALGSARTPQSARRRWLPPAWALDAAAAIEVARFGAAEGWSCAQLVAALEAAGDAVASGGFPLTPVAGMQGGIVATNLLTGNTRTPTYAGIPSVVFTTPPLARVGLDEAEARAQGLHVTTRHEDTSGWYSSRRVALPHTGFKTLVEDGTERVLGAHLLGLHAEEVINIFALAIRAGLTTRVLKDMVYAYPTSASDVSYMV